MGRGMAYLNKKAWAPGSLENMEKLKRLEAEDKLNRQRIAEVEKKRREEQELYHNRLALLPEAERKRVEERGSLDFMYTPPPGMVKDDDDARPAPEQPQGVPLGAPTRRVRCFRCGNFGHSSGEAECLLYGKEEFRKITEDPLTLMLSNEITTESGDKFKIRQTTNAPGDAKEYCLSDDDNDENDKLEAEIMAQLSEKDRKRLIEIMHGIPRGDDDSDSDSGSDKHRRHHRHHHKHHRHDHSERKRSRSRSAERHERRKH